MSHPTLVSLGITFEPDATGYFVHTLDVSRKILGKAVEFLKEEGDRHDCGVLTVVTECTFPLALRHAFIYGSQASPFQKLARSMIEGQEGGEPWGKWGGAIVCTGQFKQVLAFSGLPELWDEAVMYVLAVKLRLMKPTDGRFRVEALRNPRITQLLDVCHWTE